ncbi:MAG: hypothetical protein HY225_03625 [Candidatus Vogelbacteria bacterium]|nr:hypothetical protein [Candidatus Vogelbacteria bacterium]
MNLKSPEQQDRRQAALERFGDVWRKTREESKTLKQQIAELLPRITLLADGDSIKNQQIDVINEGDRIVVTFKLVKEKWEELTEKFRSDPDVEKEPIVYEGQNRSYKLCDGLKLTIGSFDIFVAESVENEIRSSYGLVRIEMGERHNMVAIDDPEQDDYSFGTVANMVNAPKVSKKWDSPVSVDKWLYDIDFSCYSRGIYSDNSILDWPPVVFVTNKNPGEILTNYWMDINGAWDLRDKNFSNKIVVGVRSKQDGRVYFLFLSDPKVQEFLGMKDLDISKTVRAIPDGKGDDLEVETGVNYFLADLNATYIDAEDFKYKIAGYIWNESNSPSIVLWGKDLKILSFKQFLQFRLVPLEVESKSKMLGEAEIALELENVMQKILGVKDALLTPDEKAERLYKIKRYRWAHKFPDERVLTPEEDKYAISSLERKEVAPGYFTFVEHGRAKKMEEAAPFFLYHHISEERCVNLPEVIKSNSLVSTHERFRRGLKVHGMSSETDMGRGGGDGFFLRMWADQEGNGSFVIDSGATLIFDNSILDRTDYYCYKSDRYGRTDPETFKNRMTPEDLLALQTEFGRRNGNELIFRHGISFADVKLIVTGNETARSNILNNLSKAGISNINGRLPEDFVVVKNEVIEIAEMLVPDIYEKQETGLEKVKRLQSLHKKMLLSPGQTVVILDKTGGRTSDGVRVRMRSEKIKTVNENLTVTLEGPDQESVSLNDVLLNQMVVSIGDTVRPPGSDNNYTVMKVSINGAGNLVADCARSFDLGFVIYPEVENLVLISTAKTPSAAKEKPKVVEKVKPAKIDTWDDLLEKIVDLPVISGGKELSISKFSEGDPVVFTYKTSVISTNAFESGIVISQGTTGKFLMKGSQDMKIKITSGPYVDKEVWVYPESQKYLAADESKHTFASVKPEVVKVKPESVPKPKVEQAKAPKFKPGNTVINLVSGKYLTIAKGEKGLVVNYHKMLKPEDDLVDVKVEGTLYKVLAKDFDISTPDKIEIKKSLPSPAKLKSLGTSVLEELGPEED